MTLPVLPEVQAIKTSREFAHIRQSANVLSGLFRALPQMIRSGISEVALAEKISVYLARGGAEALAFPTIVAFGKNSAEVHHAPTARKLRGQEIIMVDCGAVIKGYCSDLTRTYFFGKPPQTFIRWYGRVLEAQTRTMRRIRDGSRAHAVDKCARKYLSRFPQGKNFPHGTGHGIGRTVHEWPALKSGSADVLKTGMIVTIEPGIYLSDWGGIRIEDMVSVGRRRPEILTTPPKELRAIVL